MLKYTINKGVENIKNKTKRVISAGGLTITGLGLTLAFIPALANADSNSINFEPTTYTAGNINGQDGWSKTGPYDSEVVNGTGYGYSSFGTQSLRISNSVTSGSFGDQTFSKSLNDEAGESNALSNGYSGGARKPHFDAQFDVASTLPTQQTGLFLSVSPDRGDGARMSYVGFDDQSDGVHVIFYDVTDPTHEINGETFNRHDIATISRSPHSIKISMDFYNGPDNDVVSIYIDGNLKYTGTSWEDYYLFDTESNPTLSDNSRTVDSLLFRAGGTSVPGNAGNGYLFDNLTLSSGNRVSPVTKNQCKKDGWKDFTDPSFKNQGACVSWVEHNVNGHGNGKPE